MDEREKAQLNKQKKLVDCINDLNYVLEAFETFEEYSSQLLPTIDEFDLTHSDTYLKLTKDVRRELFMLGFFARSAARNLADYRQLCHPERKIYSIKESLIRDRFNSQSISSQPNETKDKLNRARCLVHTKVQGDRELQEIQDKLESASHIKLEKQQRRRQRIEKIELRLLRLEWAIFFLFLFQAAILVSLGYLKH